jgi:OmpA-OmpF porin, OOP family
MSTNKVKCKATWHWRALVCCSALGLMLAACSNGGDNQAQQFQVLFNTGQSTLTPEGHQTIATVAFTVRTEPGARVVVVGKTDTIGGASENLSLSRKRAQAVRGWLVAAGVPPDQVLMSWTGEGQPNVNTGNNVSEPRNRAVDIMVQ